MESFLFVPIIQAALLLVLIPIILKGRIKTSSKRLFVIYLVALCLWESIDIAIQASADAAAAFTLSRWYMPVGILITVFFFHFTVRYSEIHIKRWILPVLYAVCLALAVLLFFGDVYTEVRRVSDDYIPMVGPLFPVAASIIGILVIASFVYMHRAIRQALYSREKTRDGYIFTGFVILFIGEAFEFLPSLNLPMYPVSVFGSLLFFIIISLAMLRYRLIEFGRLFRKGLTDLTMICIVGITYVLGLMAAATWFNDILPGWIHVLLLIGMIVLIRTIWDRVQNLVDKLFFWERYAFMEELERFVAESHDISDYRKLGASLATLIGKAFQSSQVCLLMRANSGEFDVIATTSPDAPCLSVGSDSPLLDWFKSSHGILNSLDIETTPQLRALSDQEKRDIREKGVELIVPLKVTPAEISGMLVIAKKQSGDLFSENEMDILASVGQRMAIELENARIHYYETLLVNELRTQDETKTEFLHSIAHELKTPLTSLLSSTELLEEDIDSITIDQRNRIINNIQRSAASMDRRVSELLDFARSQTGTLEMKLTPSTVEMMLQDVSDRMIPVIEGRQQTLRVEIEERLPMVYADTDKLEQVVINLLSNASKYSPGDIEIIMRVRSTGDTVFVEVEDYAQIIEDEEKEKIFEPYYRGKMTGSDKRLPGLGLGLAIAKRIIELHNGTISVENVPGKGNIFSFSVPVYRDEPS